jgi:vacuolar-type H+-ATPase subunit I/STV1
MTIRFFPDLFHPVLRHDFGGRRIWKHLVLIGLLRRGEIQEGRRKSVGSDTASSADVRTTVAWGTITGSWFGLGSDILPSFLLKLRIQWLAPTIHVRGDTKQLCFVIGVVHLVWAHLKNIKRDMRTLKFLAQIGMLLQLLGMYFLVLNLVLGRREVPRTQFALISDRRGFLLNFVFANYEGISQEHTRQAW